jgi:hypothetical protein
MTPRAKALIILLCVCVPFSFTALFGQLSADDSTFYRKAVASTVARYHQSFGNQSPLYNGCQYIGYPFSFREPDHPYFGGKSFLKGDITYGGVLYPGVQLLYDEVAEVVVFMDPTHRIQLVSDKISSFSILNDKFIRLIKDSSNAILVGTGFYQFLYAGKSSVLKKEMKTIGEDVRNNTEGVVRFIELKTYYYIYKDNAYYSVKNKKNLLAIYKDRKTDIQQYIKNNKLRYKKNKDSFLIKLSTYYDQLTN